MMSSTGQPTNSITHLRQRFAPNFAFQSERNALCLYGRIDVLSSRKHAVHCAVRVALFSARSPSDIQQPRYHLSALPDVVEHVCRCPKEAQLFAGVDSGNILSHVAAVQKKNGIYQVGLGNPRLSVSVEAVNVGGARTRRKPPCAWESENNASSLGGARWKCGRSKGVSCQCDKAS